MERGPATTPMRGGLRLILDYEEESAWEGTETTIEDFVTYGLIVDEETTLGIISEWPRGIGNE